MKMIRSFNDSAKRTYGIFRQPADEWRWIVFVYDIIGNIAGSNKCWRQRRFKPSQEMGIKKMINGNVLSELVSLWFASVYGAASSIQNCVLPLVLHLQKVQER